MDARLAARALAVRIARCDLAQRCRNGEALPCSRVANWGADTERRRYPAPEPWSGHLDQAPVLFISSNPGARDEAAAPLPHAATTNLSDDDLIDIFENAFHADGRPGRIVKGEFNEDGSRQPYWAWTLETATELLQGVPQPGIDYVLTEVVHCGSQRESGVALAVEPCTKLYLGDLFRVSPARLVIAVGGTARNAISEQYRDAGVDVRSPLRVAGPLLIEGQTRFVVGAWHPSYARYGHDVVISRQVPAGDLARLREWMRTSVQ